MCNCTQSTFERTAHITTQKTQTMFSTHAGTHRHVSHGCQANIDEHISRGMRLAYYMQLERSTMYLYDKMQETVMHYSQNCINLHGWFGGENVSRNMFFDLVSFWYARKCVAIREFRWCRSVLGTLKL